MKSNKQMSKQPISYMGELSVTARLFGRNRNILVYRLCPEVKIAES